ncbi:MAG: pantoate--beta-alanine ligase [Anaerolineaceae bacterium]|jgi:pantoate--beta-alanine ligase
MKVVNTLAQLTVARNELTEPVGFVPTMGYLHEGHLSLVRVSKSQCVSTVASIFVNPTQFGPKEDLSNYPRDLARDLALLDKEGVDLVWTPDETVMYPAGFQTWVDVERVTQPLEGSYRPGHFRGVTTIVAKLFNGVRPQKAFFGQKDAQQALVIQQMTRDLSYPIEIVICPIVREPDGLAMSSRNVYLSAEERPAALILHRALTKARQAYLDGERNASRLREIMLMCFSEEPLANVQYVSCASLETLHELDRIENGALLSVAVFFGKTRLIDNCRLE